MFALPVRVFFRSLFCFRSCEDRNETAAIIVECFNTPVARMLSIFNGLIFHLTAPLLICDFRIDVIDASLRLRVVCASVPRTATSKDV